jgi:adenosine kinase
MAYAAQLSLRDLQGPPPDLVVISPNDPEAMTRYVVECQQLGVPYLYDPSQQLVRLSAADVRRGIEGALALFVNDYEFALIQKMTGMAPADILEMVRFMVVTLGENGSRVHAGDEVYDIPAAPPERIIDPTGVGDAFRGGFLTGYRLGLDWKTCGRIGSLAATYCLEQPGPQAHVYTPAEFAARYLKVFQDGGKVATLLEATRD